MLNDCYRSLDHRDIVRTTPPDRQMPWYSGENGRRHRTPAPSKRRCHFGRWLLPHRSSAGPEILLPLAARAQHIQHRVRYANRPEVRVMAHGTNVLARHKNGTEFKVLVNLGPVVVPAGTYTVVSIRSVWA